MFKPINQEYVAPVDLATLDRTYNALEQGHQAAVATYGKVSEAIANLDLNEQEDAWRFQKMNEVENALNEGTSYGNSYGALDDLIKLSSDIMRDPAMTGRLKAQKDYKTYMAEIDASNIPEDYKDYYKAMNGYNYQDKVDDKGRIIGGSKWTPSEEYVNTVPLNAILAEGVKLAAPSKGQTSQMKFYDSEGREVDSSQATTAAYYNTETKKWDTLSKDKIWKGVEAYIETTPGIKESLDQDYKIALWKNKQAEANGSYNPDVVNPKGVVYTNKEYQLKRLAPGVAAASYYNETKQLGTGKALETNKGRGNGSGVSTMNSLHSNLPTSQNTAITYKKDYFEDAQSERQTSLGNISDVINTLNGGEGFKYDLNSTPEDITNAYNSAIEKAVASGVPQQDINRLKASYLQNRRAFELANANYEVMLKEIGVNETNKDAFDFNTRSNLGWVPNENNPFDTKQKELFSKIMPEGTKELRIEFNDVEGLNKLVARLNNGTQNGIKNLKLSTGTNKDKHYLSVSREGIGNMKNILNLLEHKDFSGAFGAFYNFRIDAVNDNGEYIVSSEPTSGYKYTSDSLNEEPFAKLLIGRGTSTNIGLNVGIDGLRDLYDEVDNITKAASDKYEKDVIVKNNNFATDSYARTQVQYNYDTGQINSTRYNQDINNLNENLKDVVINSGLENTRIFSKDKDEKGVFTEVGVGDNETDRNEIQERIKLAAHSNTDSKQTLTTSLSFNPGLGWGTNVTTVLNDSQGDPEIKSYFIQGLINEKELDMLSQTPVYRATNDINNYSFKGQTIPINTYAKDSVLGDQIITATGDKDYIYKSNDKTYKLSEEAASKVLTGWYTINDLKDDILISGLDINNMSEAQAQIIANNINSAISDIRQGLGTSISNDEIKDLEDRIVQHLSN